MAPSWPQISARFARGDLMPLVRTCLRMLRSEREQSQAKLAAQAGVTRQTINSSEKGRFHAKLRLAFKIACAFESTSKKSSRHFCTLMLSHALTHVYYFIWDVPNALSVLQDQLGFLAQCRAHHPGIVRRVKPLFAPWRGLRPMQQLFFSRS